MAYALHINGESRWEDYFADEAPTIQVSFPGEEGITEWRCAECGEATQDPDVAEPDYRGGQVDPESLCESAECDQCDGVGTVPDMASTDGVACGKCAGTGHGPHDWQTEPHSWVNSARISADDDRVTVAISVGDPRGAFTMTVERAHDGTLRLSVPTPNDSLSHMKLTALGSPGYYAIS